MELFEGLKGYEIILAALGILLFLVLLFILVYYVLQNRPLKYVLPSFLIPIVMIAFPAIKKIQFGNNVIEMRETISALEANPEDAEALAELERQLGQFEELENLTPNTLFDVGIAYAMLGDSSSAYTFTDSAFMRQPSLFQELLDTSSYLAMPSPQTLELINRGRKLPS